MNKEWSWWGLSDLPRQLHSTQRMPADVLLIRW